MNSEYIFMREKKKKQGRQFDTTNTQKSVRLLKRLKGLQTCLPLLSFVSAEVCFHVRWFGKYSLRRLSVWYSVTCAAQFDWSPWINELKFQNVNARSEIPLRVRARLHDELTNPLTVKEELVCSPQSALTWRKHFVVNLFYKKWRWCYVWLQTLDRVSLV